MVQKKQNSTVESPNQDYELCANLEVDLLNSLRELVRGFFKIPNVSDDTIIQLYHEIKNCETGLADLLEQRCDCISTELRIRIIEALSMQSHKQKKLKRRRKYKQ